MMTGHNHRFILGVAVFFVACSRGGAEDPAVVLERAASTAQQLESAAFDGTFSYDVQATGMSGNGSIEGTLADGGAQLAFTLQGAVTMEKDGADQTVTVEADAVVAGENDTYLRLSKVDGSVLFLPGIGLVPDDMLDRWFQIGSGESGEVSMTPDPSFIALQTQALTVVADRSYETVDGARCYAYDVTVDPEKMGAFLERIASERGETFDPAGLDALIASYDAKGTIWIDAQTSVIRRIAWTFEPRDVSSGTRAAFTVHLEHHNEPVTITPPADAVPLDAVLPHALPAL